MYCARVGLSVAERDVSGPIEIGAGGKPPVAPGLLRFGLGWADTT